MASTTIPANGRGQSITVVDCEGGVSLTTDDGTSRVTISFGRPQARELARVVMHLADGGTPDERNRANIALSAVTQTERDLGPDAVSLMVRLIRSMPVDKPEVTLQVHDDKT